MLYLRLHEEVNQNNFAKWLFLSPHDKKNLELTCPPVCKPEALGPGIAIRAEVEQKGGGPNLTYSNLT